MAQCICVIMAQGSLCVKCGFSGEKNNLYTQVDSYSLSKRPKPQHNSNIHGVTSLAKGDIRWPSFGVMVLK